MIENNESISLQENWIHLMPNGSFESFDGALNKKEYGNWIYESKSKNLFIDGAGEKNDSEWQLEFKKDTLFFRSTSNDSYLVSLKHQ